MASSSHSLLALLFSLLSVSLLASTSAGGLQCEDLPADLCAFSVSSGGSLCILEKSVLSDGNLQYQCQASLVVDEEEIGGWIESDDCIASCGLERMSVGLSTDAFLEKDLTTTLCTYQCQNNCPYIFDLYTKLAQGEGVQLSKLCEAHKRGSHKLIEQLSTPWASIPSIAINGWDLPNEAPTPSPYY